MSDIPGRVPPEWRRTAARQVGSELSLGEILHANSRKRSAVFAACTSTGERLAVKWHADNAPDEVRRAFEAERACYARGAFGVLMPKLHADGSNFLVMALVEGRSLRDWTEAGIRTGLDDVVRQALECIASAYVPLMSGPTHSNEAFIQAGMAAWSLAAASGPLNRERRPSEALATRAVAFAERRAFRAVLRQVANRSRGVAAVGPQHADLHLDNIVVDQQGDIWVLDYGTAAQDGAPMADLLLLAALLLATVDASPTTRRQVQTAIGASQFGQLITPLLPAVEPLAALGAANARFNVGSSLQERTARLASTARSLRRATPAWLAPSSSTVPRDGEELS